MNEETSIAVFPATGKGKILLLAGRVALGLVFVYAAYSKLRIPWMLFAMSINSYEILPEPMVILVARMLPWIELLLGLLLILGWKLRWVAAGATALLVAFFGMMLRAQAQGLGIDCGCFGVGERLGPITLARDGLLVALAVAVTVGAFRSQRQQRAAV